MQENNTCKYHAIYQKIIEIADFIFKHPDKNRETALSYFVARYRKNRRTIERYYKQAQEYNQKRIQALEKTKNEVLTEQTKQTTKKDILTREEGLEILSTIAKGIARKVAENVMIPTDSDRARAIQQLAKMEGWDASIKTEVAGSISFTSFLIESGIIDNNTNDTK